MPTIPPKVYQVAMLGFSDFERKTLGSCFRLGAATGPGYVLTLNPDEADFLLADADHAASVQLVRATERAISTVYIGADPPDEAMSWMTRPIDPLRVMRELQAMAAATEAGGPHGAASEPQAGASTPAALDTWQPETQPGWEPEWPPGWGPESFDEAKPDAAPAPVDVPLDVAAEMPPAIASGTAPAVAPAVAAAPPAAASPRKPRTRAVPRARVAAPQTALVVDDSEVAARFLRRRLEPWGLQVECATTSRQALAMLDTRTFELIFVDVELGPGSELDGLALCQRIKQSAATVGANVFLVSAHQSEADRARGSLAGCDAYLGKPLAEVELAPLLLHRGLVRTEVTVQTARLAAPR